jgi:acyl-CoA reductase-like NAD-dependent aldehyde dehydrogenase
VKLIFLHSSVAPAFIEKFKASIDALRVGLPWEDKVSITPLPEANKVKGEAPTDVLRPSRTSRASQFSLTS